MQEIPFGERIQKTPKPIKEFKRLDRNAPREISSKVFVHKQKKIEIETKVKKEKPRDPRFDDSSAPIVKNKNYASPYSFLKDLSKEELTALKDQRKRKREAGQEDLDELDREISKKAEMVNKFNQAAKLKEIKVQFRKEQEKLIEQGKTPYYINSGLIKTTARTERDTKLEKEGKLQEFQRRKQVRVHTRENAFAPPMRKEK